MPRAGQRRQHLGVLVQGMIDVVVLIDGEVGADAGHVGPGVDPVGRQVDHGLVGLVGLPVPQHRERPARHRVAATSTP